VCVPLWDPWSVLIYLTATWFGFLSLKNNELTKNITEVLLLDLVSGRQSKQYLKIQTRQIHGSWWQKLKTTSQFGKVKEGSIREATVKAASSLSVDNFQIHMPWLFINGKKKCQSACFEQDNFRPSFLNTRFWANTLYKHMAMKSCCNY